MDSLWNWYGFVMILLWLFLWLWYLVGGQLWFRYGWELDVVWPRAWSGKGQGGLQGPPRVPILDSLRCQFCCLTQKLNLSIRREIADWAADHNPRSSQTSYLAIRTIYRKCMFGNSAKKIINLIITVFTSFSKQIHNKIVKIDMF